MNLHLVCFMYGHSLIPELKKCLRCGKVVNRKELQDKKELNRLIEEERRKVWKK